MRVRKKAPGEPSDSDKAWEAALVARLRSLPRPRAPALLRRRILAAIAALEKEAKDHETAYDSRHSTGPRALL
jgi:hypothetical protein